MKSTVRDLEGLTVVVTRPKHQSNRLCDFIREVGGRAISFPVLEITAPLNQEFLQTIEQLERFDLAIFISANAVHHACQYIATFPKTTKIAAVGLASAEALRSHNLAVDIFPVSVYNSEALLQTDALQSVRGKKIVIFRGEGGREFLADTLRQRGAEVTYAECYRRIKPKTSADDLLQLWKTGELDIIVVTSDEGLRNLYDMVGAAGRSDLLKTPLLLVSQRTCALALELGFTGSLNLAAKASDEAIQAALIQWSHKKTG